MTQRTDEATDGEVTLEFEQPVFSKENSALAQALKDSETRASEAVRAQQRAEQRLSLLRQAAQVLLTADDPDEMLSALFNELRQQLNVDTYFNFMVNEPGDALKLASYTGIPEEEAVKLARLEFGQAVCGNVALRRAAIVATDIQNSADPRVQLVKGYGIRSYACNPLMSGERLLGTLSFASHERDEFTEEDLDFFRMISRYVAAAYERLHLVGRLQETDRRKDEFLATLAHELRNPLAPIRTALEVVRLKSSPDPDLQSARAIIERQVQNMVRLVDDLLDVSRVTLGRIELVKERVELAPIIAQAIEAARPIVEGAGHVLTAELPPSAARVEADVTRLSQVFLNLLNNAAKYTPPGGQIRVQVTVEHSFVSVKVSDSGIGIPREMLAQVFDLFTQVDKSLGRSHGGLGIGLTLVRRIVELHGGTVEAQSEGEGKGSEFIVRLPVIAVEEDVSFTYVPPVSAGAPAVKHSVLIVDDNEDAAQSLAALLSLQGHQVNVAHDGLQALEKAEALRPGLVLLDIGMPKLNGYDTCQRLREQSWGKAMRIVALTGWGQDGDRARTREAGFDLHWVKPVDLDVLTQLLSEPLSRDAG